MISFSFVCLVAVVVVVLTTASSRSSALAQDDVSQQQQQQCLETYSRFMEEVGPQGALPRVVGLVASAAEGDDEAILLRWETEFADESYLRVLQDCSPPSSSLYFTGFCQQSDTNNLSDNTTVQYQLGALSTEMTLTIGNLTRGAEHNCTVTPYSFITPGQDSSSGALVGGRASALATPGGGQSDPDDDQEEWCDRVLSGIDEKSVFLGVVDSSQDSEIEFSWHFPEGGVGSVEDYARCMHRFEVRCDQLDEAFQSGARQAASSIQHRAGSLSPARQNLGLALLGGLETGMIYSCSLQVRVRGEEAEYRVASKESVFVDPGYPKLLKDTSEGGGNKCIDSDSDGQQNFGLLNSTALFVRNGCQGVFLLPGDYGMICQSSGSSYVECYLPGSGEGAGGPEAAAAAGEGEGVRSNPNPYYDSLEVFWQQSLEPCYSKETFGFASPTEMFVLDGCQGQFMVYPHEGSASSSLAAVSMSDGVPEEESDAVVLYDGRGPGAVDQENNFFVVSCEGDDRRAPAYTQEVQRRRWWCLFICRTSSQDPAGYYTCPIVAMPQELIGNP
jgi:hypothetical protein